MTKPHEMTEGYPLINIEETLHPEGSLSKVSEIFGILQVKSVGSVFRKDYVNGDRILITTTSEGSQGPKTGKASQRDKEGTAFIDLALTPEIAQRLYTFLNIAIKN